jgi:hypothetical protein
MEKYNYLQALKEDIREYIGENFTKEEQRELVADKDAASEKLNDDLWIADSVTGNASGSYYCNAWKAEEAIAHNFDILADAMEEFGCGDVNAFKKGAEWCDVTIRCYLLGQAIAETLNELEDVLRWEDLTK